MKERHDLPRWARLCAEYRQRKERPDEAKEARENESKHGDYVKRVRGICK